MVPVYSELGSALLTSNAKRTAQLEQHSAVCRSTRHVRTDGLLRANPIQREKERDDHGDRNNATRQYELHPSRLGHSTAHQQLGARVVASVRYAEMTT